jgi:DNA invertase Pin-like site-specific DNA recombinase
MGYYLPMTEAQKTPQNTLHIYTRVSTKSQMEDGVSLETQLEEGIKKQKSLGLEYYQLWNEESASSDKETLENRPVMRELLESVDDGQIKHLYG